MSALADIGSEAESARASLDEAMTLLTSASHEASDLAESAAGHGWAGVAQAMSSTQDTLQEAAAAVDDALQVTAANVTRLSEITGEMSSDEVAHLLTGIGDGFEAARTAATLAIASLDEPRATAQEAGARTVVERVDAVQERLTAGREILAAVATKIEAEQSAATAWGSAKAAGTSPAGRPPSPSRRRETGSETDGGLTDPSRPPDPNAVPEGEPETAPRAARDVQESLEYQNRTALALARAGYQVRRLPNTGHGVNLDFEVEGRIFDCYSPNRGTTADSVVTRVRKKSKLQASRFVINLDRSGLDAADVRARLVASRPSRVLEVLVVRNDTVSRVWP
jgi:hypothetical protein